MGQVGLALNQFGRSRSISQDRIGATLPGQRKGVNWMDKPQRKDTMVTMQAHGTIETINRTELFLIYI